MQTIENSKIIPNQGNGVRNKKKTYVANFGRKRRMEFLMNAIKR